MRGQGELRSLFGSTNEYLKRPEPDYAEQDAKKRRLGGAGEEAVLESERVALLAAGHPVRWVI